MKKSKKVRYGSKKRHMDDKDELLDSSMQALEMICDVGYDYDGRFTVEGLTGLVDELVAFAKDGLDGKHPQYIRADGKAEEMIFGEWMKVPRKKVKNGFIKKVD